MKKVLKLIVMMVCFWANHSFAQNADGFGKFSFSYQKPNNPKYLPFYTYLKNKQLAVKVTQPLEQIFALPNNINITFRECGDTVNAFNYPSLNKIDFCYSLFEKSYNFSKIDQPRLSEDQHILNAIALTLLHEIGHQLVYTFKLPTTSNQESDVDNFAMVMLLLMDNPELENAAYAGSKDFFYASIGREVNQYHDFGEHPMDKERYFNTLKLYVGSLYNKNDKSFLKYLCEEKNKWIGIPEIGLKGDTLKDENGKVIYKAIENPKFAHLLQVKDFSKINQDENFKHYLSYYQNTMNSWKALLAPHTKDAFKKRLNELVLSQAILASMESIMNENERLKKENERLLREKEIREERENRKANFQYRKFKLTLGYTTAYSVNNEKYKLFQNTTTDNRNSTAIGFYMSPKLNISNNWAVGLDISVVAIQRYGGDIDHVDESGYGSILGVSEWYLGNRWIRPFVGIKAGMINQKWISKLGGSNGDLVYKDVLTNTEGVVSTALKNGFAAAPHVGFMIGHLRIEAEYFLSSQIVWQSFTRADNTNSPNGAVLTKGIPTTFNKALSMINFRLAFDIGGGKKDD